MQKIAIVTGASRGIGYAIAKLLATNGYKVYAGMRDPQGRNSAAAESIQPWATAIEIDVCDSTSVHQAIATIINNEGRIDVLINNAGRGLRGAVEEVHIPSVQEVFDVNMFGSLRMMQACLPHMRERKSGVIIQISSISGLVSSPLLATYEASKHAAECFAESMSYEVREYGIRVAIVEPGIVNSGFRQAICPKLAEKTSAYQKFFDAIIAWLRAGNYGVSQVDDVARAVLEAIQNPATPLRVPVGVNAQTLERIRLRF